MKITNFNFKVNVVMSCLRLRVNVDYLLLLYDFFVEGLPKKSDTSASPIRNEKVINKPEVAFNESTDAEITPLQRLMFNIRIENPQFILYENQFEPNKSNTLIIDVNIIMSTCIVLIKLSFLI
jgi:hypothetical protein